MSIWITGDIHGNPQRLNKTIFHEQQEFSGNKEDNYVIICGDFGLIWDKNGENKQESNWLNWLENKPFTTLFVDGNHECFPQLYEYPVKEWNGGKVHEIRPYVLHLMRGEVFDIEGKKFFAFGGAKSHDISDGILDYEDKTWKRKAKKLCDQGKINYRVKGLSWWEEELPSKEEMQNGLNNLQKNDNKVDYIITHSPPASIIEILGKGRHEQDVLTNYLENIKLKTKYKYWFAGHMHISEQVNDKDMLIYEQIVRIV